MENRKIALLVDIDNVKISADAFNELYTKLKEKGDVSYCKFYGYNDRKHLYLSDFIMNYGYETAPFMRYKKRFSQLDNRIIVDAVKINYTKPEIDTFCIVAGDGDLIPLLVELKACTKHLIDVNTPYQEQNAHLFDEHIVLDSIKDEAETYAPKTKKVATKKVVAKKPAVKKPVVKVVEEVEEVEEPVKVAPVKVAPVEQPAPQPAKEIKPVNNSLLDGDYDLSDVLNDITRRYGELDFSDGSDLQEKINLINDIKKLIKLENAKGEGIFSENENIRQIFVDLRSICEDMSSAL